MNTSTELLSVLEDVAALIKKTQVNLKKCPKSRLTKGYIETRIKIIDDYWNTYKQAHHDLLKITPQEKRGILPYFLNEEFYIHEDLYVVLQADLHDMLTSLNSSISSHNISDPNVEQSRGGDSLVKLPRIQLPTFSGNYEEWPTFEDLFISLIHKNKTIEDVQKLHYLKSSVSGEAEALIRHIQITHKNYSQAWEALKTRYGNKRLIVKSVLKRLFLQKKITCQSANQIKCLLDTTTECLNSLKNLDINVDSWDPVINFLVVQKMDQESHKEWEEYAYKEETELLPTWSDLTKFLQCRYRTLELISSGLREKSVKERSFHVSTVSSASPRLSERKCIMCKDNHTLCHCKEFTNLQPAQRVDYVKTHNLCFNCLSSGHAAHKCRLRMFCRICHRRHHSLLHQAEKKENNVTETSDQSASYCNIEENKDIQINSMTASHHSPKQNVALLATAMVIVSGKQNQTMVLRALIDPGSQASFISEKAAQTLKLSKQAARGSVVGVGSTRTNINHVVQCNVSSRDTNFNLSVTAYVMSKQLTTRIPARTIAANHWPHLEGLHLADPKYYTPGSIDLLLGVKEYTKILQPELIKGPSGTPSAQNTNLGWILFGEIEDNTQQNILVMHHQVEMDEVLKSLWEIDKDIKRKLTRQELLCEEIYELTHTRTKEGRYVVKLPFNKETPTCTEGNTKDIARKRLLQLERRFKKTPKLKEEFTNIIEEYLQLRHMEEVPNEEKDKEKCVYLPYHAVFREDKESTKIRLVFDASCKGSNNVSLNDELLIGPPLQEDLRNLIMRWRTKKICYISDIKKMYREILVYPLDADTYQRILWRTDDSEDFKEYRILRVTFGTACAPYLAIRTLHQLADDEGKNHPKVAQAIKEQFYMDDLMNGADTPNEAINEAKQINDILKKGGFTLTKWASNNLQFMQSIPPCDRSSGAHVDLNIDGTVKALGIKWNIGKDKFQYGVVLPPSPAIVTKRSVLSDIQRLFDPLGWIAASIVMTKIFIQKLWLEKLNWDDKISSPLLDEWTSIRTDLQQINEIEVDRWISTTGKTFHALQIHGFCDASSQAYAAVVYARVETEDGTINTKLVAARTRVAPLRTISIPRLELCGALLLSRLLKQVSQAMRIPSSQIFAWTDSTIVLAWLAGDPHKWKLFVANRVVEILENVHCNKWHYVDSLNNPADIASRGMFLSKLRSCDLWWAGPKWLTQKEIPFSNKKIEETDLEMKKGKIMVNVNINEKEKSETKTLIEQLEEFETLQEMVKVLTYCRRFLNYKRYPSESQKILKPEELDETLNACVRLIQNEEFTEDIQRLKNDKPVKKNSCLKSLNPYIDGAGILRVGGRLRHSELKEKHPIIMGTKNNLTSLIVADAHSRTMHGGVQLMLCYLRSKYWILKVKGLVKKHIHQCLTCAKQKATARTQIMGDLPKERVTPSRAFLNSGVDFCGPFQILNNKGRGAKTRKAYIALFICMSTKAIHLELVGDLTSEAFIGAFKRFVARRGKCAHLWSDQGRNFIGADKELQAAWKDAGLVFEKNIAETLALDSTKWHFIPPYSPNFGGLWESGVKSVKYHLKRVLSTNLTFEEMTTVLCQIEACLNSRPLTPVDTDDPDVTDVLTPGHFLIGEAPIIVPSADLTNTPISNLTRWQHLQKLLNNFWNRWHTEYLTRLQQRPKWHKQQPDFELGDIVLVKVDGLPPGKWCLGRIVNKHPGSDGHTRVYGVKSGTNIVKRCVSKLCALPINNKS